VEVVRELHRRTQRKQRCTSIVELLDDGSVRKRYVGKGAWPHRRWKREIDVLRKTADCVVTPNLLSYEEKFLALRIEYRGEPATPSFSDWNGALTAFDELHEDFNYVHNDLHWPNIVSDGRMVTLVDLYSLERRWTKWGRRRFLQFLIEPLLHTAGTPEARVGPKAAADADRLTGLGKGWVYLPALEPWPRARGLLSRRPELKARMEKIARVRPVIGPGEKPGILIAGLPIDDLRPWGRRFGLNTVLVGGPGRRQGRLKTGLVSGGQDDADP
jgi:hypothetical protein